MLLRPRVKNQSIWRLKNGMEEMIEKLVKRLSQDKQVRLHLNEPIERIEFDNDGKERSVRVKSKSIDEKFDVVISSIYSRCIYFC